MIQNELVIGPIHSALPGPMRLSLGMVGEEIESVNVEFGYTSREIESRVAGKTIRSAQLMISRVEPESAFILDRIFCEAYENATLSSPTERVKWIREITTAVSELVRELRYLAKVSERMKLRTVFHVLLKYREALLDLSELLTGSRYGYYFLLPTGPRYEVTAGFQERLEDWCKGFIQDFERIEALIFWTKPFQNRLKSLGRVMNAGDHGFVSESSTEDTRYGQVSQVESRVRYSLDSCRMGALELLQVLSSNAVSEGVGREPPLRKSQEHDALGVAEIDCVRGKWRMSLELTGGDIIKKISILTPSDQIVKALPLAIKNESFQDLPLILESLNFSISEIDR